MPSDAIVSSFPASPLSEAISQPNKRDALLRAALELFAERTYGSTPVPDIAARARVGTGTVYRHFQSKEELANNVYRTCKLNMLGFVKNAIAHGGTVEERFLRIWNALADMAISDPTAVRFLEMQLHEEYLDEESRALSDASFGAATELLREGQKEGVVCDTDATLLVAMSWGAFVGVFKEASLGRFELDANKLALAGVRAWRMVAA
jgi:TetR/AcrR family transcriptional regulator, repressor of fatR-cypB operon